MNLPVLINETKDWVVVAKPSGWLSVAPSGVDLRPIILDWVRRRGVQAWPVHRLDVETSGVLFLAKSVEMHKEASLWFQKRKIKKLYHAITLGRPEVPTFKVTDKVGGLSAITLFEVKERFTPRGCLIHCVPHTGRRHQIRQHLANRGLPIAGDKTYGGEMLFSRVALHAARLEIPSGEVFEAEWPEDFMRFVETLRKPI